eukprot:UN13712
MFMCLKCPLDLALCVSKEIVTVRQAHQSDYMSGKVKQLEILKK